MEADLSLLRDEIDEIDSELNIKNMESPIDSSPVQLAERRQVDDSSPPPPDFENDEKNEDKTITKPLKTSPTTSLEKITEEPKLFRCCIDAERLNQLRLKVEEAIRERKTFTVKGGFQFIRNGLLRRGWIEKIEFKTSFKNISVSDPPSMDEVCSNLPAKQEWETSAAHQAKCEKMVISRLLQHHEVDFYWSLRKDSHEWQQRLNKNKIINRFSRSLFTSKEGLCLLLQQMYWHNEPGVAFVRFPRCYTINFADQCSAFVEDFRLTACISLLKWFLQKLHTDGAVSICSDEGKVPISAIQFALDRCNEYIAVQKHVDLDKDFHKVWDHEWDNFLTNFSLIIHKGEKFEDNGCYSLYAFETSAKNTLKSIIAHWPQIELDGVKNVWIMKPGNKCRGRDIILVKDVHAVVRVMNHKLKYVVQKYIERPLLIHKTKFDIRQWFMVTCVQPLTIWMYRDCYLRFSTQKFSLDSFHESVHLTNHAVQHKYSVTNDRDRNLPDDNMWDNHTFKAYLRQIGQAEKWYKVIYPGMKECIIGSMLASQDTMDRRPNTFELYGADFMIAENFTPWLIEINSCPAMGHTTSVTSRMCPQCFDDLIKVVIDRRRDPKADTGCFELIYKQNLPNQNPAYLGMTLSIRGKKIFKKRSSNTKRSEKKDSIEHKHRSTKSSKPKLQLDMIKNYNGPVIGNLIEELQESLFKTTMQTVDEMTVPPAPQVSLVNALPLTHQRPVGVPDPTPVQRATVSFSCKQRSKPNFFHSTKSNAAKEKIRKKSNTRALRTKLPSTPTQSLSLYSKWKQGLESKSAKSSSEKPKWEKDTASILNNKSDILPKPKLVNSCIVSSIARILPEIDTKNTTAPFCQNLNLFTVGLGYKNLCYKPVIKENIILPVNNQSTVDGCFVKL